MDFKFRNSKGFLSIHPNKEIILYIMFILSKKIMLKADETSILPAKK